jgi:hypothetical protein
VDPNDLSSVVLFPTRQILTTDFRINTDQKIKKPDPLSSVASVSSVVLFPTLQILTTDFRMSTDQENKDSNRAFQWDGCGKKPSVKPTIHGVDPLPF